MTSMTSNRRKLYEKLKDVQMKLDELTNHFYKIPCLTIDGLQGIPFESEDNWQSHVTSILTTNHIHKSWILNMLNPSENVYPNTVTLQFINNIVCEHTYNILSNYVIANEYDTIITKE
jgi:hypothetical protein